MRIQITAAVFDVLGTVVDERGTAITETTQTFSDAGLPADQGAEVAERWLADFDGDTARRARREARWEPSDLRAAAEHDDQTAFVDRPDADAPNPQEFDLQVRGLEGLTAELMNGTRAATGDRSQP